MAVHLRAAYDLCGEDLGVTAGDLWKVSLTGGRGVGWTLTTGGWIFFRLFCTWAPLIGLDLAICTLAVVELAWRDEVTGGPEAFLRCHLPPCSLLLPLQDGLDEAYQHGADGAGVVERRAGESGYLFSSGGSSQSWNLSNWSCG